MNSKLKIMSSALVLVLMASSGCTFFARSAEDYQTVTRELVNSKSESIRSCYDTALKTDEGAGGKVIVNFVVAKKTGIITNPAIDPRSDAATNLSECVVSAIDGLTIDPPDQRDGMATFTWEFTASR